jgi:hypothetical protein
MAARFWVGGSGTWDNSSTANWSATTGGASGASAPTTADTATFDSNSGTAATVTVASTAASSSTTVNKSDIVLSLSGSPTLCTSAGTLTLTTGAINLNGNTLTIGRFTSSNSNTRSIAFGVGSVALTGNAAAIWNVQIADNFTYTGTPTVNCTYSGSTGTRTILHGNTSGGVEANSISYNISAGTDILTFANSSKVKSIDFTGFAGTTNLGGGTFNIFGGLKISSGMTLPTGTSTVTFSATSSTQQITTAGKTFDFPLAFNGNGGTFAFQDALTQGSTRAFTITNGTVQLKAGVTSTVGAFATSGSTQKFLQSTSAGVQATLTQAGGTVNANNLTIKDISAIGGATWNAYTTNSNVDAGNNLGWDFSLQIGRCIYTRRKNKRILP